MGMSAEGYDRDQSTIRRSEVEFIQRAPSPIDGFESRSPVFSCHPLVRAAITRSASSTIASAASTGCELAFFARVPSGGRVAYMDTTATSPA